MIAFEEIQELQESQTRDIACENCCSEKRVMSDLAAQVDKQERRRFKVMDSLIYIK